MSDTHDSGAVHCPTAGKIAYHSRSDATRAIASLARSGRNKSKMDGLRAYQCRDCGEWHIGHRTPPSKKINRFRRLR